MLDDIIHRPLLILNLCILGLVIVDVIHYGVEEISLFPFPYSVVDYCAAGCPPPPPPPPGVGGSETLILVPAPSAWVRLTLEVSRARK